MKYEYQKEGSEMIKTKLPWWSGLRIRKTNERGMFCFSRHYPHRLCWDWSFWFGVRLDRRGKRDFWFFSVMDLPGCYQWQAQVLWIFDFSYASQVGKSDWMLTERAEDLYNRYLDTPPKGRKP